MFGATIMGSCIVAAPLHNIYIALSSWAERHDPGISPVVRRLSNVSAAYTCMAKVANPQTAAFAGLLAAGVAVIRAGVGRLRKAAKRSAKKNSKPEEAGRESAPHPAADS